MRFIFTIFATLVPIISLAQGATPASVIVALTNIIETLSLVAIGVAFLVFVWGLVTFLMSDIPNKKTEGRSRMIWSVVALFVLSSIWGIVKFIQDDFFGGSMTPNNDLPIPDREP